MLDVSKGGRTIEYALLVEIHHPDYLRLADLRAIYGAADATGRESSLDALLATAARAGRALISRRRACASKRWPSMPRLAGPSR